MSVKKGERGGAVVTGAGRGLGKLLAGLLVARGHHVLVTDVDLETAKATASTLGPNAYARALDVRDAAQTIAARDDILARAGALDVWINNAGVLVTGPAWEQDASTRRLMLEVNALGTMNGTIVAIEAMRGRGGHIVNIVSLAGITAVPGESVYAASKHAAIGFSLSTLADLRLAGAAHVDRPVGGSLPSVGEQVLDRHVGERRVAEQHVAVMVALLADLGEEVEPVELRQRADIVVRQHVQHHQRRKALAGGRALVDIVAAVAGRDRHDHVRPGVGEVVQGV